MNRKTLTTTVAVALAGALGVTIPALAEQPSSQSGARTTNPEVEATYQSVKKTYGFVPTFFKALPELAMVGAWEETQALYMNPNTALPGKTKALVAIAIDAQASCHQCLYFDTQMAKQSGATDGEIKEAIGMSAVTRQWSTVLNGMQIDENEFKKEMARVFAYVAKQPPRVPRSADTNRSGAGAGANGAGTTPDSSSANPPEMSAGTAGGSAAAPTAPADVRGTGKNATNTAPIAIIDAASAYKDIEHTLGIVPSFLRAYPEEAIAAAWRQMKEVQLSSETALPPKTKELIGLGVAAQIPCKYCVSFHTSAAKLNGATDNEIKEAVAMAALTREWSTMLNGSNVDEQTFRKEVDQMMREGKKANLKASK